MRDKNGRPILIGQSTEANGKSSYAVGATQSRTNLSGLPVASNSAARTPSQLPQSPNLVPVNNGSGRPILVPVPAPSARDPRPAATANPTGPAASAFNSRTPQSFSSFFGSGSPALVPMPPSSARDQRPVAPAATSSTTNTSAALYRNNNSTPVVTAEQTVATGSPFGGNYTSTTFDVATKSTPAPMPNPARAPAAKIPSQLPQSPDLVAVNTGSGSPILVPVPAPSARDPRPAAPSSTTNTSAPLAKNAPAPAFLPNPQLVFHRQHHIGGGSASAPSRPLNEQVNRPDRGSRPTYRSGGSRWNYDSMLFSVYGAIFGVLSIVCFTMGPVGVPAGIAFAAGSVLSFAISYLTSDIKMETSPGDYSSFKKKDASKERGQEIEVEKLPTYEESTLTPSPKLSPRNSVNPNTNINGQTPTR